LRGPGWDWNFSRNPVTYIRNIQEGKKEKKSQYQYIFSWRLQKQWEITVGEDVLNQANAHTQLAGKFALASQGNEK
jgi:hypothetical protein